MPANRLIGHVSDEQYSAIAEVAVDFERDGVLIAATHSTASGVIHAELADGEYEVVLAKAGFGAKRVHVQICAGQPPLMLRLLSDSLYGYAWPKWVRSGETAEFRVHSPEAYRISLWRYGQRKELVQQLGWFDEHAPRPNLQTLPDRDFTETGVLWNRRGYAKDWRRPCPAGHSPDERTGCTVCRPGSHVVTAPSASGLYFFHVETASGGFLSFPWIVAPAQPSAHVAVLASSNTWNAYNSFGGRSNYLCPTGLPAKPTVNARLEIDRYAGLLTGVWSAPNDAYLPLSFDRPEPYSHIRRDAELDSTIPGRQAGHLVEAEWKLLGWLERQATPYDFYSDRQLDEGQLDLGAYDVLILSTHPEYWSKRAYLSVKEWVEQCGGRLMYLGGNGIDCEVEYFGDSIRCRSWQPWAAGTTQFTDPTSGRAYDCRFHFTTGESPSELLGVVYTEPGVGTSAPFCAADASHWIFANTNLKNGDVFGTASLHERCSNGASGHETDKRSPRSPANTKLLATGLNGPDAGAEMVYHETTSGGGAVFSAGSITWPSCVLVDCNVSRITRNVVDRFLRTPRPR